MATKTFKIGLSNTDKQNMAQDVYERVLALTFAEYDSANTYNKGDFVVYNDTLYQCKQDNTTGTWDSSKWQQATLQDLLDDIEGAVAFVNDKANVDGNYPTMTVGAADNLTPYDEDSGVDQEQPFLLQGTGCGNGEQQVDTGALGLLKEKQGNSIVVNQKVNPAWLKSSISGDNYSVSCDTTTGEVTITVTETLAERVNIQLTDNTSAKYVKVPVGHKYFYTTNLANTDIVFMNSYIGAYYNNIGIEEQSNSTDGYILLTIRLQPGLTAGTYKVKPQVVDLTQWFGSNDNIPAHLLAHPEDFFRYYQGSLAYNEGTLVNSNGRYLKTIGRNQWDEEWEEGTINQETGGNQSSSTAIRSKNYIKVIPNTDYYFKHPDLGFRLFFYDKDYNMIENKSQASGTTVTTPSNCCYIRFYLGSSYGTTYNNDITISIYYEDESGYDQYYPYEELANIDTGTETLRSAGSVKDSKAPDGTITRRVGTLDFSSATGSVVDNIGVFVFTITNAKGYTENALIDAGYTPSAATAVPENQEDKTFVFYGNGQGVQIKDTSFANESFDTFKASLSGKTLYYELATPTTEQGTTFSENVAIDDFGSMDFGGTNNVPQGASIFYAVDYKAFIDSLYNTLDGDATDIVKESELDSKLATLGYVKLTSVSGYDATKTQVLKNVEGTLTWVTEE